MIFVFICTHKIPPAVAPAPASGCNAIFAGETPLRPIYKHRRNRGLSFLKNSRFFGFTEGTVFAVRPQLCLRRHTFFYKPEKSMQKRGEGYEIALTRLINQFVTPCVLSFRFRHLNTLRAGKTISAFVNCSTVNISAQQISCSSSSNSGEEKNSPSDIFRPSQSFLIVVIDISLLRASTILYTVDGVKPEHVASSFKCMFLSLQIP